MLYFFEKYRNSLVGDHAWQSITRNKRFDANNEVHLDAWGRSELSKCK